MGRSARVLLGVDLIALVLLSPSPPAAALPRRPEEHELRAVAAIYDAAWWGWTGTREQLRERMPDMDDADVDKITQLMSGARESGRARRERMAGIPIDTSRILDLPSLVIVPASKLGVVDAHDHLFLRSAALSGDELDDLDRSAPDRHY